MATPEGLTPGVSGIVPEPSPVIEPTCFRG